MNAPLKSELTLSGLAAEALSTASGKTDDAIAALVARLAKDKVARTAIASAAINDAIRNQVTIAHHNSRTNLMRAMLNGKESVRSLASGLTRTILDFPLLDGTKLRDASTADLDAAIHRYRTQADTMNRTANWLVLVRNLTPAQGRVGDVVDDATAQRLFEEASK